MKGLRGTRVQSMTERLRTTPSAHGGGLSKQGYCWKSRWSTTKTLAVPETGWNEGATNKRAGQKRHSRARATNRTTTTGIHRGKLVH